MVFYSIKFFEVFQGVNFLIGHYLKMFVFIAGLNGNLLSGGKCEEKLVWSILRLIPHTFILSTLYYDKTVPKI